jgi:hypothetical protein
MRTTLKSSAWLRTGNTHLENKRNHSLLLWNSSGISLQVEKCGKGVEEDFKLRCLESLWRNSFQSCKISGKINKTNSKLATVLNNDLWKGNKDARNGLLCCKPICKILFLHKWETNVQLSKKIKQIFVWDIILSTYFTINISQSLYNT